VVLYLIWLTALWFHLSHGMWSGMQTLGASGKTWLKRIKVIGIIWSTVVILMFVVVVVYFALGFGSCGDCASACGEACQKAAECNAGC